MPIALNYEDLVVFYNQIVDRRFLDISFQIVGVPEGCSILRVSTSLYNPPAINNDPIITFYSGKVPEENVTPPFTNPGQYAGKSWTESFELPPIPQIQPGQDVLVVSTINLFVPKSLLPQDIILKSIINVTEGEPPTA